MSLAITDPRTLSTPGLAAGDYIPLSNDDFLRGFAHVMDVLMERFTVDHFETTWVNAANGQPATVKDTLLNRAWFSVGRLFEDDAVRVSFHARFLLAMEMAEEPNYERHIDLAAGTMHIAAVRAFAQLKFNHRITKKARRSAFDAEFRRQLAAVVDSERGTHLH